MAARPQTSRTEADATGSASSGSVPPGPSVTVDAQGLEHFTEATFLATGMEREQAAAAADVLVRTSLRGVESHGVAYLHQYVRQLLAGGADPRAGMRTVVDRGAMQVLDGQGGLGLAVAMQATHAAIARARAHGVGLVSVRGGNHFGAAGHYALTCAEAGCIGLVMSNTPPIMAATGARTRSIGNSPIGFGAPRVGGPPFVLDIAMSRVAGGKVRMAMNAGEEVPPGWILDPEGNPTTAPEDFLVHKGALLPMEQHKGYGLSLMVETLAGALSGAAMASAVGNWLYTPDTPSGTGYFLLAVDVSTAGDFADFGRRLAALCDEIASAPRVPSVDRIFIPGELEHEHEQRARAHGLQLRSDEWSRLGEVAAELSLTDVLHAARR
jgi:LDH2 family malate/lactate/ureidoglycolate dehydrogenase